MKKDYKNMLTSSLPGGQNNTLVCLKEINNNYDIESLRN